MSDKPLNDELNAVDADMADTNAEHGPDAHPSDDLAPLDAVIAERDEWKDRALRVAAEMENQPPDAQAETCRRRGGVTPGGVVLAAAALLLLGAGMRFFFHGTAHLLYPRG